MKQAKLRGKGRLISTSGLSTAISSKNQEEIVFRGFDLIELMRKASFVDIFLLGLLGRKPTKSESKITESILISSIDHGFETCWPSRMTIGRAPEAFQGAVAVGILNVGNRFGGATEPCARLLQEGIIEAKNKSTSLTAVARRIVEDYKKRGAFIPGLGHAHHKNADPRAVELFKIAKRNGLLGDHFRLLGEIRLQIKNKTGKLLPINVDGSIAAIISDMGIEWRASKAFFILGRTAGAIANVYEEIMHPTYDFMLEVASQNDSIYTGPRNKVWAGTRNAS